jgi:hypothetical protein
MEVCMPNAKGSALYNFRHGESESRHSGKENGMNLPSLIGSARLPEIYVDACNALSRCEAVDECKDWSDKAAAMASYGRQAKDETLLRMATRIRLRALQRAGELLKEIDGRGDHRKTEGDHGSSQRNADKLGGGAPTKLTQRQAAEAAGFSEHQQLQAVRIANVPGDQFDALVEADRPPSVTGMAERGRKPIVSTDHLKGRSPAIFNRILHLVGSMEQAARWAADYLTDADETMVAMTASERRRLTAAFETIGSLKQTLEAYDVE